MKTLRDLYGPENLFYDLDEANYWAMSKISRFIYKKLECRKYYEDRSRYKVIHGHIAPRKYRKTCPNAIYVTFFRHPVQQAISHYYYWLRTPDEGLHDEYKRALIEQQLDLKKFVCRQFNKRKMRATCSRLDLRNFDFVGITEFYDASLSLLKARYLPELPNEPAAENVNPSKKMGSDYEVDEKTLAFITSYLSPLIDHYEKAIAHFRAECLLENIDIGAKAVAG